MTTSELESILERLETLTPSSRVSEKRQLLTGARERIMALRQRGHSWRSLARELSAAIGENVSADLLRAACVKRFPQRRTRLSVSGAPAAQTTRKAPSAVTASTPNNSGFGAKGLKL